MNDNNKIDNDDDGDGEDNDDEENNDGDGPHLIILKFWNFRKWADE